VELDDDGDEGSDIRDGCRARLSGELSEDVAGKHGRAARLMAGYLEDTVCGVRRELN